MRSIAWSAEGGQLITGGDDKTARLWDAATGQCLQVLKGASGNLYGVSLAPGLAVAASDDKVVRLYDPSTGELRRELTGHETGARACCASADGAFVASAESSCVRLWDTSTGSCRHEVKHSYVHAMRFGPDSRLLCTGGSRGEAHIFDTASGERLRNIEGFTDDILSMRFSACGTYIIAVSEDCTVRVFEAATCRCLAAYLQPGTPCTSAALLPCGSGGALKALASCKDGRMLFLEVLR